jgi:mRNA interferase MazF
MAVNPQTVPRDKVGEAIGRLPDDTMLRVNRALALFLGFA